MFREWVVYMYETLNGIFLPRERGSGASVTAENNANKAECEIYMA